MRRPHAGEQDRVTVREPASHGGVARRPARGPPAAARRMASGWPAISARNLSGKFPNDFISTYVTLPRGGSEDRSHRRRQYLHPRVGGGLRPAGWTARGRRAGAARHRPRPARGRGRPGRADHAQARLPRHADAHHRSRAGDHRGVVRAGADPGGRAGRAVARRDHPRAVRLPGAGDHRRRWVRQGAADGAGRARHRRGHRPARRAGGVAARFHQSRRARDAGARRPRPPRDWPLQHPDRVPAHVGQAAVGRSGARAARARRA